MAGEYIMRDANLGSKPEILEIVELTGCIREVVCYRVEELWCWASMNTADGTIRATPARLAMVCGGDADFWLAVERVGWIKFDPEAGTMTVSGWEKRFSKAAKARIEDRNRKAAERLSAGSGGCPDSVRDLSEADRKDFALEERRVDEKRRDSPPPHSSSGKPRDEGKAEEIRKAWDAAAKLGIVPRYESKTLPSAIWDRLADPAWGDEALRAIDRLPGCRFLETPPPFRQFVGTDRKGVPFVSKILAGDFDARKKPRPAPGAPAAADGRPSAEAAAERFEKRDPKREALVREFQEAKARRARA
jgi:hypothetical protein